MTPFSYVVSYYGVPACLGRIVIVGGKQGVIAEDRGHYIGINFDSDKAGVIKNAHPTSDITYLGMSKIRKPSRSSGRYARYLEYGDGFNSFLEYCYWDAEKERSWNGRNYA